MDVEYAGALNPEKKGDIPQVMDPPQEFMDEVFKEMWDSPPKPFDPRLQHKAVFKARVKAGGALLRVWPWAGADKESDQSTSPMEENGFRSMKTRFWSFPFLSGRHFAPSAAGEGATAGKAC